MSLAGELNTIWSSLLSRFSYHELVLRTSYMRFFHTRCVNGWKGSLGFLGHLGFRFSGLVGVGRSKRTLRHSCCLHFKHSRVRATLLCARALLFLLCTSETFERDCRFEQGCLIKNMLFCRIRTVQLMAFRPSKLVMILV